MENKLIMAKEISEKVGYLAAMVDVINYLKIKTEFNPDKRYIDSVELIAFCHDKCKPQSKIVTT
ncbi:MAG: hypothetical protein ABI091_29830 [Ferruginibacter sp.]